MNDIRVIKGTISLNSLKNTKKKFLSKSQSQYIHTKRNFMKRFGLFLTVDEYNDLVEQIRTGKAQHIETQTNRVSVWRVDYEGNYFEVVYDNKRKTIATVLPKEYADELGINFSPEMQKHFETLINANTGTLIEIRNKKHKWFILPYENKKYLVAFDIDKKSVTSVKGIFSKNIKYIEQFLGINTKKKIQKKILTSECIHIKKDAKPYWIVEVNKIIYLVYQNHNPVNEDSYRILIAQEDPHVEIPKDTELLLRELALKKIKECNTIEMWGMNKECGEKATEEVLVCISDVLYKTRYNRKNQKIANMRFYCSLNKGHFARPEMQKSFLMQIKNNSQCFVKKLSQHTSLWEVKFDREKFLVVYNSLMKAIENVCPKIPNFFLEKEILPEPELKSFLVNCIQSNKAVFIGRSSMRNTVWKVTDMDTTYYVSYNTLSKKIKVIKEKNDYKEYKQAVNC